MFFNGLSFRSTLRYIDGVLIFSETFEQSMHELQEVFSRFRQGGLKLSPKSANSHSIARSQVLAFMF